MRPTNDSNQILVLKWTIKMMQFFGTFEKKPTIRGYIGIASLCFMTLQIFLNGVTNWDGIKSLRSITFLPGIFLCVLKGIYLVRKSKDFMHLFGMLRDFWRADSFDEETEQKVNKVFTLLTRIIQGYIGLIVVFCIIIVPMPAFDRDHKTLIFTDFSFCNMQTNFVCWISNYVYQVTFLCHGVPSGIGFDFLLIISTGYIYNACQLLNAGLARLNTEESEDAMERKDMLRKIVAQHDCLLDFVHKLNALCTTILGTQFLLALCSMIICLYMITANGIPPSIEDATYFSLMYMIFMNQLLFSAASGSIIEEQIRNLSTSIYSVNWYGEGRTDMRKDLSFMIQRAQNSQVIRAGILSDLNLALFQKTINQANSIFMLIWQVSNAQQ